MFCSHIELPPWLAAEKSSTWLRYQSTVFLACGDFTNAKRSDALGEIAVEEVHQAMSRE
jgi:hypothetical protein